MTIHPNSLANGMLSASLASLLLFNALPAHADSTIQKCTAPDGKVTYQQDVCPGSTQSRTVAKNPIGPGNVILVANSANHYTTTVTINGVTAPAMIDTGATYVAISTDLAQKMHLLEGEFQPKLINTANGMVRAANKVVPMLKIANIELYNVEISITPNVPTLIGMSALSQLSISTASGNMTLSKR